MLNLCPLLGETGLEKPRTNMAAPAPSVHQATEEAAETTSVTKVRTDGEIRRCTAVSANNWYRTIKAIIFMIECLKTVDEA